MKLLQLRSGLATLLLTTAAALPALLTPLPAHGQPAQTIAQGSITAQNDTVTIVTVDKAGAAGVRNYVTACQMVNTSATVNTIASLLDGSTVVWTGYLPATTAALPVVVVNPTFPTPLRGTAATAMNIQLGTTAAAVYYNCQGYQAP